ncbi:hypothetical protein [Trebonia sp.]|uniref:hypothetical protein n=1 Tax=Trebonia sp. TaxID=2767075 RepID=UPI00263080DA|nr:hypothetical protein [Trebonia sp.]
MSDEKSAPAAWGAALAGHADDAHPAMAFARAREDRAAIVANNDLVSEVGW